jgi:hypothetical protein
MLCGLQLLACLSYDHNLTIVSIYRLGDSRRIGEWTLHTCLVENLLREQVPLFRSVPVLTWGFVFSYKFGSAASGLIEIFHSSKVVAN